ncbi:hypothetical protein EYF80_040440 [Liparis tanakae]|uniref:Uncharacterized protein n=1 Tax=Liparis tanakae TaxID=230148 RepID=A0A4Z2G790_9TELE|nr:hypothetical protein EYF80_040440 [Liparis tanakae]
MKYARCVQASSRRAGRKRNTDGEVHFPSETPRQQIPKVSPRLDLRSNGRRPVGLSARPPARRRFEVSDRRPDLCVGFCSSPARQINSNKDSNS